MQRASQRENRICKGPMEGGSMKELSERERLRRSIWHKNNYSRVDGIRIRDSGKERGRDQTIKGFMCTIKNFSLILRAM